MKSENFYDQLASDEYVVSQAQFKQEMQQIKTGVDRDLMASNLQESSGLVNQLGLKEPSLYNQNGVMAAGGPPPNFGRREQVNLGEEDFNLAHPSARNPRESSDLTIDMLQGKDSAAVAAQRFLSGPAPNHYGAQNMPRNSSQPGLGQGMRARPAMQQQQDAPTSQMQDGFSIEQFRQNNAQLHEIMMQLQQPAMPQMAPSAGYAKQPATDDKFKQLSCAQTGYTGSNPSTKLNSNGVQSEVSQFNFGNAGDEGELPGTSQPMQYNYAPAESQLGSMNPSSYQTAQYSQAHQQFQSGASSKQEMPQPSRSTSPIGFQQPPVGPNVNYRQAFKPNSAFQTAGQSIVDHKENMNVHNTIGHNSSIGNRGPSPGMPQGRHHVSQVELLSQLQQSSSQASALQHSSIQNQVYGATQGRNAQPSQQMYGGASAAGLSHNGSQPSLAGEFTLQPRQPGAQPEQPAANQAKTQLSQGAPPEAAIQKQHNRIMMNFDDIPISKIQKMPGYQTGLGMLDGQEQSEAFAPAEDPMAASQAATGALEDEEAQAKPLPERVLDSKWSIRLAAYKEIHNAFYNDYAQYQASKAGDAVGQGDPDLMASFDQFGPLLQKMIQDQNSIAALEGYQVIYTYVKLALDIKSVTFAVHNYLLEKAPTHKANFRDICLKVLLVMIDRGQASFLYPELIKRMRSAQQKIASFTSLVINEAFKQGNAADEINLRTAFRMIQDNLSQKNKELRECAMQILQHIYARCGDDMATFLANCKNLRPVQAKEIQAVLAKIEKSSKPQHQAKLFDGGAVGEDNDHSGNAREAKDTEAHKRHGQAAASAFEAPQRDSNHAAASAPQEQVDLTTLVPENFSEIPYLSQINVKRRSMESFNGELAKLYANSPRPGSVPIKNRDYMMIYNTVAHMLEDKNMLVFLEGIKTVELLALLIGPLNYLKQPKVKLWIGLLAGKYGETKTAVIAAVDKAMIAIVRHAYNQVQFAGECVNTIASTHKNPRVKQFVIEHTIMPFVDSISSERELVGNIFRIIKEKLVQMILKDNSAACRDAAVSLLVTFKQIIPTNPLIESAITALPKYRVSEIHKRINPDQPEGASDLPTSDKQQSQTVQPAKKQKADAALSEANSAQQTSLAQTEGVAVAGDAQDDGKKPKFAKSLTQRINSAKQQAVQDPNQNSLQSAQTSFVDEILARGGGKFLTHETKMPLTEILYDLGTMQSNRFADLYDSATMEQKWEASLRQMGELGVRECKALIISAVFTVLTTPKISLYENQQSLKSMLNLVKRLCVLERSIQRDDDGKSQELQDYIRVSLLQNVWIVNNQGETCQMLQIALIATKNAFEFTEQLREVVEQPLILQCPAALQIIEAVYVWLGIRLNDFLAGGMQINDLEMLRGFGIKYLDGAGFSEPQRQALIGIMIKFKDLVQFKRGELGQAQNPPSTREDRPASQLLTEEADKELPSVSQLSRQHTPHITGESDQARLQSSQISHPQTAAFAKESLMQESVGISNASVTPRGAIPPNDNEMSADNICRLIDTEFEKGLLLFKDMAQQQTLDFEIKQRIFVKLLSIVNEAYKSNPQQQYKQAYALKALMWMKEETLGIEDCFRLTQKVMHTFANSEVEEMDSTVELYLLNFWTKDLSIRDLADRLGLCVLSAGSSVDEQAYQTGYSSALTAQSCTGKQRAIFNSLIQWFSEKRLFAEETEEGGEEDEWLVSDLRKIVFYMTVSVLDQKLASSQSARKFLKKVVQKFGLDRVKEFMEIQLMHHSEMSLQLLDWLDSEFESRLNQPYEQPRPEASIDNLSVAPLQQTIDDQECRVKLPAMPQVNLEELQSRNARQDMQSQASAGGDSSLSKPGSRQTPRGLAGASQSYKERRDQYKMKSSVKARESLAAAAQPEPAQDDLQYQSVNSYSDIISRIEQNLSAAPSAQNLAQIDNNQIAEASGESDEKDQDKKNGTRNILDQHRAEDDYYLREQRGEQTDIEESLAREDDPSADQPFRRTNTSAYYRSIEKKRKRYAPSAEELADDHDIKGDSSDEQEDGDVLKQEPRSKAVVYQEHQHEEEKMDTRTGREQVYDIENRLELSNIKGRHINDKIQMLELEKDRIEQQSELLKQQKDEESQEWRNKVANMEQEHAKVIQNLSSVNNQYSAQVQENESLKMQLQKMQMQHTEMMSRFEQIEKKLEEDRHKALSPAMGRHPDSALRESTAKKEMVVSVQKIQRIEDTFGSSKALTDGSQEEIMQMIQRIQRLLLGVEKNVEGELAQPLIIHYTKLKMLDQRMQMLEALNQALDQNEDVLTALSALVYKALLNYLLWAFAHEKQILESTSISAQGVQADQNQVTMLSQQLVSKLLNSKRFTTSLVCLFQLLREAMPNDIAADLTIEERQYLRVVMRCIQRITRALHSEQPDMVRAFDVLLEMQKMFQKHPPELLREDLPCLADFDFIYRGMKDVSDKLIELQPEKVESFLNYASGADAEPQNAFIKYLVQMLGQR